MIIAAFVAIFAACSQDDGLLPDNESLTVQFTAGNIIDVQTRTSIDNTSGKTQWMQNDAVGIFMTGDTGNRRYTVSNTTTGTLSTDAANILRYPGDGSDVYFIAYYPYNNSQTLGNYTVNVTAQTDPSGIDLLYARPTSGYNYTSKPVNLEFNHALAKLKMEIMPGIGFSDMKKLAGAEVQNVSTAAGFDLSDGTTFNSRVQGNITPRNTSTATQTLREVILIPGKYTSGRIKFTVDGNNYFWDISGISFESGNLYDYQITVNKTGLTISSPNDNVAWGNGGSENITGS